MTYPEHIMKSAREAYITLAKSKGPFQVGISPKGEACCHDGEYDDSPRMRLLADITQAAEQCGYERAVEDAANIAWPHGWKPFSHQSNLALRATASSIRALKKGGE